MHSLVLVVVLLVLHDRAYHSYRPSLCARLLRCSTQQSVSVHAPTDQALVTGFSEQTDVLAEEEHVRQILEAPTYRVFPP